MPALARPRMLTFTPGAFPRDTVRSRSAAQAAAEPGERGRTSAVAFKPAAIPGLKAGPAMDLTFTMMPGVVTCLLDNALDTTKPGKVFCHTDETVYSPLGVKLMEAGTRIVGDYQSDIGLGENRVGAVAAYAITPNGVPVPLGSFPMGDGLGRGGFDGELDTHPWARIGSALVLLTTQGAIGAAQTALQQRGSSYTNVNVGGLDYRPRRGDPQLGQRPQHAPGQPGLADRPAGRAADRLLGRLRAVGDQPMRPGERPLRRLLDVCGFAAPLADPLTTEVVVNRPGEIGVERDGLWTWHAAPEATFERLETIAVYAAHAAGAEFDEKHPLARGTLPDGERLQACRPKATRQGVISLTVRKPAAVARRVDDPDFEAMFSRVGTPRSTAQDVALIELKRRRAMARVLEACGAEPPHDRRRAARPAAARRTSSSGCCRRSPRTSASSRPRTRTSSARSGSATTSPCSSPSPGSPASRPRIASAPHAACGRTASCCRSAAGRRRSPSSRRSRPDTPAA